MRKCDKFKDVICPHKYCSEKCELKGSKEWLGIIDWW